MPRSQKADIRPIAFALHNTATDDSLKIYQMAIRPEDLTRSDVSRLVVHQTLGGAWADNWGPGLPTISLSGHTGWGAGTRPDGFQEFQDLYETVFAGWHDARQEAIQNGTNPDDIKLIFADELDDFTWAVAPQSFVLKRNKSRPLLSTYQISMIKLEDSLVEIKVDTPPTPQEQTTLGIASLDSSLSVINKFSNIASLASKIRSGIASALGPIMGAVQAAISFTAGVLSTVRGVINAVKDGIKTVLSPLLSLAKGMTQVLTNVMSIVSAIKGIPAMIKGEFMALKGAFQNVGCLLSNVFNVPGDLPDYNSLKGASNCSSTAGGAPVSEYANKNAFPEMFPAKDSPVKVSSAAGAAIKSLGSMDVLSPPPMSQIGASLTTINSGVSASNDQTHYLTA